MTLHTKGFQLTGKLSPDKGLQVQKDVLSYAHFQLVRGKVSFKKTFQKNQVENSFYLSSPGGNRQDCRQHEYKVETDIQEPTLF